MKENLALDKYKDNVFPGALLIALNAGPESDTIAVETTAKTKVNLTVNCIQAINLPALDDGNFFLGRKPSSDPYCQIIIKPKKGDKRKIMRKTTKPRWKTLNPRWEQKVKFDNVEIGDTLSLKIWDRDVNRDDAVCYIKSFPLPDKDEENYKKYIGRHWFNLIATEEAKEKNDDRKLDNMRIKLGIRYTAQMELKKPERKKMQLR